MIGIGYVGAAFLADAAGRVWELAIGTFVWPMAPGLMALGGASRARRQAREDTGR